MYTCHSKCKGHFCLLVLVCLAATVDEIHVLTREVVKKRQSCQLLKVIGYDRRPCCCWDESTEQNGTDASVRFNPLNEIFG